MPGPVDHDLGLWVPKSRPTALTCCFVTDGSTA
jgi:hypothetical protein